MLTFSICVNLYTAALKTRASVSLKNDEYFYKSYLESKIEINHSMFLDRCRNINDDRCADKNLYPNWNMPYEVFSQFDIGNQSIFLSHLLETDWETYMMYCAYLKSIWIDYLSL